MAKEVLHTCAPFSETSEKYIDGKNSLFRHDKLRHSKDINFSSVMNKQQQIKAISFHSWFNLMHFFTAVYNCIINLMLISELPVWEQNTTSFKQRRANTNVDCQIAEILVFWKSSCGSSCHPVIRSQTQHRIFFEQSLRSVVKY